MDAWSGVLYMGFSDRVILDTIKRQLELRGPDAEITHSELADACGASRATAQRAVKRLMSAGKVEGIRRTRGYLYRIRDDATRT